MAREPIQHKINADKRKSRENIKEQQVLEGDMDKYPCSLQYKPNGETATPAETFIFSHPSTLR